MDVWDLYFSALVSIRFHPRNDYKRLDSCAEIER